MIKKRLSVAVFGGSFDPPHIGHQTIVRKILDLNLFDKLVIVPTFLNPFKSTSHASPKQRLTWCRELFASTNTIVSDYEINQQKPIYTIDTIRELQKTYIVKYLVIGSDNLNNIDIWKEFDKINSEIVWIVISRDGYQEGYDKLRKYISVEMDIRMSSSYIRESGDMSSVDDKIKYSLSLNQNIRKKMNIQDRIDRIVKVLDDKKAEKIEVIDLRDTDYIAKEVIVANSFGGKHTIALYEHLKTELKPKGEEFLGAQESDDWVVVDLGDIIIHIMTPAYREKYSIEDFLNGLNKREVQ